MAKRSGLTRAFEPAFKVASSLASDDGESTGILGVLQDIPGRYSDIDG